MRTAAPRRARAVAVFVAVAAVAPLLAPRVACAQTRVTYPDTAAGTQPRVEIFGQFVTDLIHDFNQNAPAWFDVMRPTQLPAFPDEFGRDGRQFFSVRPSRFGLRTTFPTRAGTVDGILEWDLFGVGSGVGRTTFNLLRAYAEIGKFGAGQFNSLFMDIDVFPNSLEYWGPSGMTFFYNVQVRYMPIQGDSRVALALERPGASADKGDLDNRIELRDVVGRFPWPDLSAEGRYAADWGYVELAGILRGIYWDDAPQRDTIDLDGSALGWGLSLSANVVTSEDDVLKLQLTYGEAIQSYVADAPFDVGVDLRPGDRFRPIVGQALPVLAGLAFYDHTWNGKLTTSLGYSGVRITNSDGQSALAFHSGQYALINLLYTPAEEVLFGGELQWGYRKNAFDGFGVSDFRIQLTARVNYSITLTRGQDGDAK